jgi:hypothetical protein
MTPQTLQVLAPVSTSVERSSSKREFGLVVASLTVLYLVAVTMGNRRYVWFDELFTFDIARSTSLHQLWDRVVKFDCTPPTSYLLSRWSMSILGPTPFGLRFPSMLEFYAGSMVTLLYVKRKVGTAFAALAVLMLWSAGPTLYHAVEARAYALLFMSFACLLLSWDTAIRADRRTVALVCVAISTLFLTLSHVFAPLTLFAFVAAELVRFRRRRTPDYRLWAALLLPMIAVLLYIPLIRLYGGLVFTQNQSQASFHRMLSFYDATFNMPIMFLALLAALVVPSVDQGNATKSYPEEVFLFGCLFLSPILLNLVLMHRHGLFYDRYCITSQAAILIVLAMLLGRRLRLNSWAAYAASGVLVFLIIKTQIIHVMRYPVPSNAGFLVSIQPNLPIVVGSGTAYMEMNHHESAGLLSRLYFLKDQQASLQYSHTNYFQDFEAPDVMKSAGFPFTGNVAPYASFVREHNQFLLLGDLYNPSEWIFPLLRPSGAVITPIGDYGGAMPYTDHTLFLVTIPSSVSQ